MVSTNPYKLFMNCDCINSLYHSLQFYEVSNDFLFSIKPILFLHCLLVLKTEEQDKSLLCMCVYLFRVCVQLCWDVHIHSVCLRVCREGRFWLQKYAWFKYLIGYSCYDCIHQFFMTVMFVFKMENVRCCIFCLASLLFDKLKLKLTSFLCIFLAVLLLSFLL